MSFALSSNNGGKFRMVIYRDGTFRFTGAGKSPKDAMVAAIAQLLVVEQRDFHEVIG
jgi:hypothetical protein